MNLLLIKLTDLFRHPVKLLFYTVIPIISVFLLGILLEEGQRGIKVPIALVDEDESEFSELILKRMKGEERIQIIPAQIEEAEKMLLKHEVDSVFIIKDGFQKQLFEGKEDSIVDILLTDASVAYGIVREAIAAEILRLSSNIQAADWVERSFQDLGILKSSPDDLWNEAFRYTDGQWEPEPLMTANFVLENVNNENNEINESVIVNNGIENLYSPYIGIWTFFAMLVTILSLDWLVKEKTSLFPRMKSTAKGMTGYLIASIIAIFVLHLIQLFIFIGIGNYLDKFIVNISLLGWMAIYILFSLSIGVLLAAYAKNIGSFYLIAAIFSFIISLIGGSFFPVDELLKMINFGYFQWLPQQWVIQNGGPAPFISIVHAVVIIFVTWLAALRRLQENL